MKFLRLTRWLPVLVLALVTAGCGQSTGPDLAWTPDRTPLVSAHRGGPVDGYPENAIETFQHTVDVIGDCLIECDIRQTRDGVLIMMHDKELDRTTTGTGYVDDHDWKEIQHLHLVDNNGNRTRYKVPTLRQTLDWAKGKAILTLDVKADLYKPVIDEVRNADAVDHVVIITYTLEQARQVHELAPEMMISASASGLDGTDRLLASGIPHDKLVAFVGVYEPERQVYDKLHAAGIRAILGTMHNLDNRARIQGGSVYRTLVANGADILATDRPAAAAEALK